MPGAKPNLSRMLLSVALFTVSLFAFTSIPVRTSAVVDRSACRSVPSVLFPGQQQCPTHTKRYRGGVGVFDVSVSAQPTGSTTSPGALKPLSSVRAGFNLPGLLLQLVVCLAIATAIILIIGFIVKRGRRTPPYGAVRRRSRLRGDT